MRLSSVVQLHWDFWCIEETLGVCMMILCRDSTEVLHMLKPKMFAAGVQVEQDKVAVALFSVQLC